LAEDVFALHGRASIEQRFEELMKAYRDRRSTTKAGRHGGERSNKTKRRLKVREIHDRCSSGHRKARSSIIKSQTYLGWPPVDEGELEELDELDECEAPPPPDDPDDEELECEDPADDPEDEGLE